MKFQMSTCDAGGDSFIWHFNIGSDNGWSPVWGQAITQNHSALLSIAPAGLNFREIRMNTKLPIYENAFEYVLCEIAVVLSMEH